MTSREIVIQTLAYQNPERVAMSFPQPYPHDFIGGNVDIPNPAGEWKKVDTIRWERTDEWGNRWARIDATSKGEVIQGALPSLDDLDAYEMPNLGNSAFYERAKANFQSDNQARYRIGNLYGFTFNIARKIRKLEQYFVDLAIDRARLRILHDRIDDLLVQAIVHFAQIGADAIMFGEDWGTQLGLLIHPQMWREEFKPRFFRLCDTAKSLGLKVFMHSCGKMTDIIPDLIECGIDVLQFDQPRLHGLDHLASFSGRVTYWCPVDIQTTLQTKNINLIEADAIEMLRILWRRGGFIAGYYGDNPSIGLEPEWQDYACRAFIKYGRI